MKKRSRDDQRLLVRPHSLVPNGTIDFDTMREEVFDYLRDHSRRRQAIIAKAVGLRRERISVYAKHRRGLSDINTLQRMYDWVIMDKQENGRI